RLIHRAGVGHRAPQGDGRPFQTRGRCAGDADRRSEVGNGGGPAVGARAAVLVRHRQGDHVGGVVVRGEAEVRGRTRRERGVVVGDRASVGKARRGVGCAGVAGRTGQANGTPLETGEGGTYDRCRGGDIVDENRGRGVAGEAARVGDPAVDGQAAGPVV